MSEIHRYLNLQRDLLKRRSQTATNFWFAAREAAAAVVKSMNEASGAKLFITDVTPPQKWLAENTRLEYPLSSIDASIPIYSRYGMLTLKAGEVTSWARDTRGYGSRSRKELTDIGETGIREAVLFVAAYDGTHVIRPLRRGAGLDDQLTYGQLNSLPVQELLQRIVAAHDRTQVIGPQHRRAGLDDQWTYGHWNSLPVQELLQRIAPHVELAAERGIISAGRPRVVASAFSRVWEKHNF